MRESLELLLNLAIVLGIFWAYPCLCIWRIARKTNTADSWMAWIPLLNLYLVCRIGGESGAWVLACLIPYVGIIVALLLLVQLPKALGVKGGEKYLVVVPLVNYIYLGYLAFRREKHQPLTSTALSA
jgi:hypothetical protein